MRLSNFFIESIGIPAPRPESEEPDSRGDLCGAGPDPMYENSIASTMRFTERAAMVVRIVGEEAGDRIWIPLSPTRLESADPFVGAHRSFRHRS